MAHTQLEIKNATVKAAPGASALVDYADAIDNVKLQTEYTTGTFKGVSGKRAITAGSINDKIVINLGDSLKTGEFWSFLRANHGVTGKVEFCPAGGTTPKIAADVMFFAPGSVGGAEGANSSSVTLECLTPATITAAP
ncbi:major tail protein [Arthrobacter phage Idaho]|uniref:Major tail protein n=1 Tax=Arthrobacter phage Idaho TaxID=2565509 RepID=A0A4D6T998_9CAUD|nr:major tail protein [Arthrobacter phage Idaho]QCG78273.1 major tail protein [Arthrobacter phage Idaho]